MHHYCSSRPDHPSHLDHPSHHDHSTHHDHSSPQDHSSDQDHPRGHDHSSHHNHENGGDHCNGKIKDPENAITDVILNNIRSDSISSGSVSSLTSEEGENGKADQNARNVVPVRAAIVRHSGNGNDPNDDLDSPVEGLSEGVLAIKTTESASKEIWKRPPETKKPTGPPLIELFFQITSAKIMPPESENVSNVKKYVIYELCVKQYTSKKEDPNPACIERRYTDFLTLYENLKKDHNQLMQNIVFPRKVLMGNFSAGLMAERSTAFEALLYHIVGSSVLRDSTHFLDFIQDQELVKACRLLDERRNEQAVPILENCFIILNKFFMDRSKPVLLMLCRLVAACTSSPLPHPSADKWAELALRRYEGVCDTDLLVLYIPLLHTCAHLWWQLGRDNKLITERLTDMSKKGIKITDGPSLTQAIHTLDPKGETI